MKGDVRHLGERAVSATALAGCGRGRDGRGCEEWRYLAHASASGSSREGRGCATEGSLRDRDRGKSTLPCVFPNGQGSPCRFMVAQRPKVDTRPVDPTSEAPKGTRCGRRPGGSLEFPASSSTPHRSALCCGEKPSLCGGKAPQASGRGLSRDRRRATRPGGHGSPTSCRPCARSPPNPSRPGRLIAVTASQDRDETSRTQLGLPHRPGQRPSPRTPTERPSSSTAQASASSPPARRRRRARPVVRALRRRRPGCRWRRCPRARGSSVRRGTRSGAARRR